MFDIISMERTKEMNKGRLRGAITARTRYLGRSTNTALDSSRLQRPGPASSWVCRKIWSGHSLKGVCIIEERLYRASNEEQSGRFADSQTCKVGEKFTSVFNFSEKIYKNVSEGDKKKRWIYSCSSEQITWNYLLSGFLLLELSDKRNFGKYSHRLQLNAGSGGFPVPSTLLGDLLLS